MKIVFAQGVRGEFVAATQRYSTVAGAKKAIAFKDEVHHIQTLIAKYPDIGAPTVSGCRFLVLDRFPFSVVYRQASDALIIIAIPTTAAARGTGRGGGSKVSSQL